MKWLSGIPSPLSWKATKLTTYPSGGTGSQWSDGGTLHSGWFWLALGRRRPSQTNSSSFLSITEERSHASAGRIWLFLAMVVEEACGGGRGRGDGSGEGWLKGA
jgi:hypothetical protein